MDTKGKSYLRPETRRREAKPRSDGTPRRRSAGVLVCGVHAVALSAERAPAVWTVLRAKVCKFGEVCGAEDYCALPFEVGYRGGYGAVGAGKGERSSWWVEVSVRTAKLRSVTEGSGRGAYRCSTSCR